MRRVEASSLPILFALLLIPWHIGSSQAAPHPTGILTVFAAASLTEPFQEIGKELERLYPGLQVLYNFAGLQTLRTQLEQGAQADIFASADSTQMEPAKQNRVIQGETPIFSKNRLVVIVPHNNPGNLKEENNVKQVVLKIQLGEADAGIVYMSDVTPKASQAVRTIPIPDVYNRLASYPIALTQEVQNRIAAEAFIAFVLSKPGQAILQVHHFIPLHD